MVMCFSNSACMYANISCMYSAYKLRELLYHTGVFLLNLMFLSMLTTCFSYRYLCTILELYAYSLIPSFFNHFTIHFCFLTCFRFCDQASACNSSIFGDCSSLCSWCIAQACRFESLCCFEEWISFKFSFNIRFDLAFTCYRCFCLEVWHWNSFWIVLLSGLSIAIIFFKFSICAIHIQK